MFANGGPGVGVGVGFAVGDAAGEAADAAGEAAAAVGDADGVGLGEGGVPATGGESALAGTAAPEKATNKTRQPAKRLSTSISHSV
jgi:hypothetical protein